MKRHNAYQTVCTAMYNARVALKPAIMDLAATDDDYALTQVMKIYLSLEASEQKTHRLMNRTQAEI